MIHMLVVIIFCPTDRGGWGGVWVYVSGGEGRAPPPPARPPRPPMRSSTPSSPGTPPGQAGPWEESITALIELKPADISPDAI